MVFFTCYNHIKEENMKLSTVIRRMLTILMIFVASMSVMAKSAADYLGKGHESYDSGLFEEALEEFELAAETVEDDMQKKEALTYAAQTALYILDYSKAWNYARAANRLKTSDNSYDLDIISVSVLSDAACYYEFYDFALKCAEFERDLIEFEEGSDSLSLIYLYYQISDIYARMGDYENSLHYLQIAIEKHEQFYEQYRQYFSDELTELQIREDILLTEALINDYTLLGKEVEAIESAERIKTLAEQNYGENHTITAGVYISLGNLYTAMGDYDRAEEFLLKGGKIYYHSSERTRDVLLGESSALFGLAEVWYYQQKYEDALKAASSALYTSPERSPAIIKQYYSLKALCNTKLGNEQEALSSVSDILRFTGNETTDILTIARELFLLSDSWLPEDVSAEYEEQKNSILNTALTSAFKAFDSLLESHPERAEQLKDTALPLFYAAIQFSVEQQKLNEAFTYSERMRSMGFLSEIGEKASLNLPGLTQDERNQLESLTQTIAILKKELAAQEDEGKRRQLALKRKEKENLEASITERIPQFEKLRSLETVSLQDAQDWCGKKRVILEFVLYDPSYANDNNFLSNGAMLSPSAEWKILPSYCLVITKDKTTAVPLDSNYNYSQSISQLRDKINKGQSLDQHGVRQQKELYELRTELYAKLITPLLPYIPKETKSLLIVPDGLLSSLPFDVLGDGKNKDLGELYTISLSPSISVSMQKQQTAGSFTSFLGIGDAVYSTDAEATTERGLNTESILSESIQFSPENAGEYYAQIRWKNIPGTGTEINTIHQSIFKKDKSKILLGQAVTE